MSTKFDPKEVPEDDEEFRRKMKNDPEFRQKVIDFVKENRKLTPMQKT